MKFEINITLAQLLTLKSSLDTYREKLEFFNSKMSAEDIVSSRNGKFNTARLKDIESLYSCFNLSQEV